MVDLPMREIPIFSFQCSLANAVVPFSLAMQNYSAVLPALEQQSYYSCFNAQQQLLRLCL